MKRETAWYRNAYRAVATVALAAMLGLPLTAQPAHAVCTGDCDATGTVTVNELITMVNIALGLANLSTCPIGDLDGNGSIEVNEIITAVNNALNGCIGGGACGDKVVNQDPDPNKNEECDDGGICIGNALAGTVCTKDADCGGGTDGVCAGGSKDLTACNSTADCPGTDAKCVRCKTFGGDGCAANCTNEHDVVVNERPGELVGSDITPGTSNAIVHGDILTIPLPFAAGTGFTLTLGGEKDKKVPGVIKAASVKFPPIAVSTLACACVRGVEFRTCGGTLYEVDGSASTNCTEGYGGGGAAACAGKKPCTPMLGAGNSGTGTVGCESLEGVDFTVTQNAGGASGVVSPPVATLTGTGGPGSAIILNTNAIGTVVGLCDGTTADYGTDGLYCTDDDPGSARGTAAAAPNVTGTASATMFGANGVDGNDIGPFTSTGKPLACSALASGSASGGAVAGAFTQIAAPTVGDIVVTNYQEAE